LPRHQQWIWNGTPLRDRHVLVRCYHGLGDTIQFARFLPDLQSIARHTTVWAQPWLMPLLETMPSTPELRPLHDGTPEVDYDVDIEIMELGHALRVSLDSVPPVALFDVPPAERPAGGFSIGVVAAAGDWDARRSVPAELYARLADRTPAATMFSLQQGTPVAGLHDAQARDVLTLAGRLRALDLVITADTMMAHLAGSLGVATWTLVPADGDWRWMTHRSDSPWYPSMQLFRQPRAGDWQSVFDDLELQLRRQLQCAD
jgi:ADP-heptose:LPS heptosyltransferase